MLAIFPLKKKKIFSTPLNVKLNLTNIWGTRSDLRGRDRQESSGFQLVDPSIQDANPWEVHLDQVCCKHSSTLHGMADDNNDTSSEVLEDSCCRTLHQIPVRAERCTEGNVDAARNMASAEVLNTADVDSNDFGLASFGPFGGSGQ